LGPELDEDEDKVRPQTFANGVFFVLPFQIKPVCAGDGYLIKTY
jgi:hypothetical protein